MNSNRTMRVDYIANNLRAHFETLSDSFLKTICDGVAIHYHMGGDVVVLAGSSEDRKKNGSGYLRNNGWFWLECENCCESTSAPQMQLAWLGDQVEFCAEVFDEFIEQYEENGYL